MKKVLSASFVFASIMAVASVANAADICKPHEKSTWLSKEDATAKIMTQGNQVKTLEEDSGCWKMTGANTGKDVTIWFDPVTAEPVKVDPAK